MRRASLIGGAILVVAIFAIGIFYYLGAGNGPSNGGFFARLRSGFSTAVTNVMTPGQMAAAPEFAFHRLEIDRRVAEHHLALGGEILPQFVVHMGVSRRGFARRAPPCAPCGCAARSA